MAVNARKTEKLKLQITDKIKFNYITTIKN